MYVNDRLKKINRVNIKTGRDKFIRLDQNENLQGIPNKILRKCIRKINSNIIGMYPDESEFLKIYSNFLNIPADNISLTNGSVVAMDYIFKVFGEPDKDLLCVTPTFGMYKLYANMVGLNIVTIEYDEDHKINVDKFISKINKNTSIISIVNPNMPIGDVYKDEDLRRILNKALEFDSIVILDEAYYHFCGMSCMDLLKDYKNLIILRTFSKMLAIAGLRLGVVLSNADVIKYINTYKPHYTVNALTLLFATEIIKNYSYVYKKLCRGFERGRDYLVGKLTEFDYEFIPTNSCHMCVFPKNKTCGEVVQGLRDRGILVFEGKDETQGMIRVTITKLKYMKKFISAMLEVDVGE